MIEKWKEYNFEKKIKVNDNNKQYFEEITTKLGGNWEHGDRVIAIRNITNNVKFEIYNDGVLSYYNFDFEVLVEDNRGKPYWKNASTDYLEGEVYAFTTYWEEYDDEDCDDDDRFYPVSNQKDCYNAYGAFYVSRAIIDLLCTEEYEMYACVDEESFLYDYVKPEQA